MGRVVNALLQSYNVTLQRIHNLFLVADSFYALVRLAKSETNKSQQNIVLSGFVVAVVVDAA